MSSPSFSTPPSGPPLEAFKLFANDKQNEGQIIAKKYWLSNKDKNPFKTSSFQNFQWLSGGTKTIVP